jgi:hypothetical protein
VISFLIPLQALILMVWLLVDSAKASDEWLHPFRVYNVGTVLAQFAVVLGGLLLLNRWIASRTTASDAG